MLNEQHKTEVPKKDKYFFKAGMHIVHLQFGEGVIIKVTSEKIRVKFSDWKRGEKDFDRNAAAKGNVIIPLAVVMKRKNIRER